MNDKNTPAMTGRPDYDDEVLDAGWVPPPEALSVEPEGHPPVPNEAASKQVDDFLDVVYRSQGSDIE
ncbi:hypothetical protein [Nitrogeniibacter aestuarii]|uniref:hypothetical protein n=1 Tax=Nitrogeniibacter aestuarii TaxID=2815343 RepID=UPI001D1022EF|nr:hypothetical protein [Nitrogeniibacter aestuarii]